MDSLKKDIAAFIAERDWDRFHSPRNLATGLTIEAAELLEIFLWMTDEQSERLPETKLDNLQDEIGDVMIYLTELAGTFHLDPIACARRKLAKNKSKYPADLVRGKAKKYTEYE